MSYQGWTNYPTWCIHLWIANEEGSYNYWREQAQDAYDNGADCYGCTKMVGAKHALADQLKDEWSWAQEELSGIHGFWSDLMSWALSEVNWTEVAEALLEEVEL